MKVFNFALYQQKVNKIFNLFYCKGLLNLIAVDNLLLTGMDTLIT